MSHFSEKSGTCSVLVDVLIALLLGCVACGEHTVCATRAGHDTRTITCSALPGRTMQTKQHPGCRPTCRNTHLEQECQHPASDKLRQQPGARQQGPGVATERERRRDKQQPEGDLAAPEHRLLAQRQRLEPHAADCAGGQGLEDERRVETCASPPMTQV